MLPTQASWLKHTRTATRYGLSAGAVACLGRQPTATASDQSFTGYYGRVHIAIKADAYQAAELAASAIGTGRGVFLRKAVGCWELYAPISKSAYKLLTTHPRVTNPAPAVSGVRTPQYDAAMRPTARARIWARAIMRV